MNSLSWLIYFANVCGNIGVLCVLVLIFGIASISVWAMAHCATKGDGTQEISKPSKWLIAAIAIAGMVATLIPDKDALYAIAASEVGERAYNSTLGQELSKEAIEALRGVLQSLKPKAEEKKK